MATWPAVTSDATAGSPSHSASMIENGIPSERLGERKTSAAACQRATSGSGSTARRASPRPVRCASARAASPPPTVSATTSRPAAAQLADRGGEDVAALALPLPAEVQQDLLVLAQPELGPHTRALLVGGRHEGGRVDRVREEGRPVARGEPRPQLVDRVGRHAQDPLDAAAEQPEGHRVADADRRRGLRPVVDVPDDLGLRPPRGGHERGDVVAREVPVEDRGLGRVHLRAQPARGLPPVARGGQARLDAGRRERVEPLALGRRRRRDQLRPPSARGGGGRGGADHRDEAARVRRREVDDLEDPHEAASLRQVHRG